VSFFERFLVCDFFMPLTDMRACHVSSDEKLPSAQERYQKEILRVFGVLESVLSKQEWFVILTPQ
jgi:glutathione S-transferase